MCPCVWILQQGDTYDCPSPAALSAPFGEPLSSTVSQDVYPVPFPTHNILYMVYTLKKLLFCNISFGHNQAIWKHCHKLGMGMGTAVL